MPTSLENLTPEQIEGLVRSEKLLTSLLDNADPETRKMTLRLLKKKHPNMSIPEVDAEAAVAIAVADEKKAREALESKVREQDAREAVRAKRDEAVEKGWITREALPELEKFMLDNELTSYEKAAKLYKSSRQAESAAVAGKASTDTRMRMPDTKELWKDPRGFALTEANKAVDEILAAHRPGA